MKDNPIILFLGDSITEGGAATCEENIYSSVCCQILGATRVSYGLGGTRIAEQKHTYKDYVNSDQSFFQRAQKMQDEADIVVVFGGVNDFGHGDAPLGDKNSKSLYTFYGALKNLYSYLISRYGKEKIIVILPLHTAWDESKHGEFFNAKKEESPTLEVYVNVIREIAKEYGLKILDIRDQIGIPKSREKELYYNDGLHPTDVGHKKIGELLADFIKTNF